MHLKKSGNHASSQILLTSQALASAKGEFICNTLYSGDGLYGEKI